MLLLFAALMLLLLVLPHSADPSSKDTVLQACPGAVWSSLRNYQHAFNPDKV
jgi:hypothetical protein